MRSPADIERKRGPAEHRHRVVPGMTRAKLYQLFAEKGFQTGAEIGVADGRNALAMCQAMPLLHLYCVDPWELYAGNHRGGPQSQHDGNYELAKERLNGYDAHLWRKHSMDAVELVNYGELDFVYVDGNHAFEWVVRDIIEWSKRVRKGGIIAGHDFYRFRDAGVVEAVVAYTQAHGITDWQLCDESEPSFWWVKK